MGRVVALSLYLLAGIPSLALAQGAPDLTALVGQTVDVELASGKQAGGEVTKVVAGTTGGSIRSLTVRGSKSPKVQTIGAAQIVEIHAGGQPLDVVYDKKARTLAHSPEKRAARIQHQTKVNERLAAQRHELWRELSDKDHEEWIARHKAFIDDAQTKIGRKLNLIETRYYLFYTDMSPQTVGIYVAYLDAMYDELCKAFNIPAGKNIWCGKCLVVAFAQRETFENFENAVFQNPAAGVQGLCHSFRDGNVVISCWKGDHDSFFANTLVHETAHGFLHRWKSTVHIPSWVNEGIADWVAGMVVKDKEVPRRQKTAVEKVRQTGSLGGTFFDESRNIESWQYGVASALVEMLLRKDPSKYRTLLTGIKEGLSSEESLKAAYGLTPEELLIAYGRLAGLPNLRP